LLGVGAVVLLVVLSVQLSISISGLQEQVRRLAEETAFLREQIEDVSNVEEASE
jgi:cell division protein FtsB